MRQEDLSFSLGKVHTPRELLIMMNELLHRLERMHAGGGGCDYAVAPQDLEIAVQLALDQAV